METNHVAATRAAEARCADLAKSEGKIRSRAEVAARKLADAEADQRKLSEKFAAAEDAYADDPSTEHVNALGKAREALELAKLRLRKPRAEHEAAQAELTAWQTSRDAAASELKTARLRHEASLELFHERTAEPFKRLIEAREALNAAATEIDRAYSEANAASRELREPGLAQLHLIAPLLDREVARCGSFAAGLLLNGNFMRVTHSFAQGLAAAFATSAALDALKRFVGTSHHMPERDAKALLQRVFACRTSAEAEKLVSLKEAELEEARRRAARAGEEDERKAREAEQKRLAAADAEFDRVVATGLALLDS